MYKGICTEYYATNCVICLLSRRTCQRKWTDWTFESQPNPHSYYRNWMTSCWLSRAGPKHPLFLIRNPALEGYKSYVACFSGTSDNSQRRQTSTSESLRSRGIQWWVIGPVEEATRVFIMYLGWFMKAGTQPTPNRTRNHEIPWYDMHTILMWNQITYQISSSPLS